MPPDFGEFLHLAPENRDFAIFSNFCFLNNFLLKSQNKVQLVLAKVNFKFYFERNHFMVQVNYYKTKNRSNVTLLKIWNGVV